MYRIYLKHKNSLGFTEIVKESRTTTPSPLAAEAAFRELISRTDLVGKKAAAVLSLNSRHLMYHRFDRSPGDIDFVHADSEIRLFHDY